MRWRLVSVATALTFVLATVAWKTCTRAPELAAAGTTEPSAEPAREPDIRFVVDQAKTDAYIAQLDPEAIALRGSDYTNPRYDLARLGKPVESIDPYYDYDFVRLAAVEKKLAGVDRRAVLETLYERVTAGSASTIDAHRALLRFLQRASFHHTDIRPIRPDGERVTDPLVLLELNEMRCDQTARLAVDLWNAGGFTARGVHLAGHSVAEVFYDDAWHYFDADTSGAGFTALMPDGTIPSVRELATQPSLLDAPPYRFEIRDGGRPRLSSTPARSHHYFRDGPPTGAMQYFHKKDTSYVGGRGYGWRSTRSAPRDWPLGADKARYQPGAVRLLDVVSDADAIDVRWSAAHDWDGDLIGYRVYVSTTPRGWSYPAFGGRKQTRAYWSSDQGWSPEMYDALYRLPPHDIDVIEVTEPRVHFDLGPEGTCYITVMPFDAYGERVGRTLYLMSNELQIARGDS